MPVYIIQPGHLLVARRCEYRWLFGQCWERKWWVLYNSSHRWCTGL